MPSVYFYSLKCKTWNQTELIFSPHVDKNEENIEYCWNKSTAQFINIFKLSKKWIKGLTTYIHRRHNLFLSSRWLMPTSQCRGTQIFWYFRSPSANHRYVPNGHSCFINIPALAPLNLVTCCKRVRRFWSHRKVSSPEGNNHIWPAIVSYRKQSSHQTNKVSRILRALFLHHLGSDGHIWG